MCGIAGIIGGRFSQEERQLRVERMKTSMAHRGPDGEGIFADQGGLPAVLGHRRLAIIDPEHGAQPMTTPDGRFTVVFNGAIYNYLELRRELTQRGRHIQTYSDTEVLLHSYAEWGADCVHRLNGMFAFAVWDSMEGKLFLARDRLGIKPLYYFHDGHSFTFGSEIKAVLASGLVEARMNRKALSDYLTFQFFLEGKTLFENIRELAPGCSLTVKAGGSVEISAKQYWDLQYEIEDGRDETYFADKLMSLIEDAVRLQLRSDVPLGAHLSGGMDSSLVVCVAASMLNGGAFHTFTGAFAEGKQFDETEYAKVAAEHAGVQYHEIFISGGLFPETLPKLMYYMDQPQAGPGLYPQYFVSKLAAEHVKVVLGGQGADELFIGYTRYLVAYLEKCLAGAIYETADNQKYAVSLESMVPNLPALRNYAPMLRGFFRDGLFEDSDKRYFKLISRDDGMRNLLAEEAVDADYSPFESYRKIFNRPGLHSLVNQMTYFDVKASLPALLHVEDRTSMSVSLESRVPLMDHRIAELMASIPPNIKFKGGRMKSIFKQAARNKMPGKILDRKDKMGFPVPLNHWIKSGSAEFVRDVLLSERTRSRGLFNVPRIEEAVTSQGEFGRVVWGLLCLELWCRIFIDWERPA
ncbi:MAG: asparagine synthase (glutamine-hydrolyzing) [Nitrospinae bacterium]|nr:asparagine synthase (glutamine-hydrolyzing) [Nitrospinota bacterium]